MSNKILLFGATGYTGRLTAKSLIKFGANPLLLGRNPTKLKTLSNELGGLNFAQAQLENPSGLTGLIEPGDILITTVGPFTRYGDAALRVALQKRAHYIDSTGEPGFIRKVFKQYGPQAKSKNITLLTAMGYDYVPGHCAAAAALNLAETASRVDVGYFVSGDEFASSQGTQASITQAILEPGLFFRHGQLVEKRADMNVRRFTIAGRTRPAASIPGSEHIALPNTYPQLQEINTYLGWFGFASYLLPLLSAFQALLFNIPGYYSIMDRVTQKLNNSRGEGPDANTRQLCGSEVQAITYDKNGNALSEANLLGANPYEFTADMLALSAIHGLESGYKQAGALGPLEAFGYETLLAYCEKSGLKLNTCRHS